MSTYSDDEGDTWSPQVPVYTGGSFQGSFPAIDGQGIALARTMLAANDLIAQRLVRLFRTVLPLKNTYWIVCPKTTRALPKIVAFRDWLLTEVAADRQRIAAANEFAMR